MRREEVLFDAITSIREDLVEEAQNYAFRRRVRWERWAGLAACLVLAAFLSLPLLPSGGNSNSSADQAAPSEAEAVPPAEAPSGSGDGGDGGAVSGEPAPGASEGVALLRFKATVLEVREDALLVEPDPGTGITGQVAVPLKGLDGLPALGEGDRVSITADSIQETAPARLTGVTEIALAE